MKECQNQINHYKNATQAVVIDLTDETVDLTTELVVPEKCCCSPVTNRHPRFQRENSLRRKRERQKRREEERQAERRKRLREEMEAGGVNFIVIDEDPSDTEEQPSSPHPPFYRAWPQPQQARKGKRTFDFERHYNYQFSTDAAAELQERMFREAAERARRMAQEDATINVPYTSHLPTFAEPVFDVATRYPDHWKSKNPYACLGLPDGSSLTLVKSQYRRLARLYHPDKAQGVKDTANKFHGITMAYSKLTQSHA